MRTKLPPFGKTLVNRLACGDIPQLVHIMAGRGAWDRAKDPSATAGGCAPLVLDGDWSAYAWPVDGCAVRVEVGGGMDIEMMQAFAQALIDAGATGIIFWMLDRDDGLPVLIRSDGIAARMTLEDLRTLFGGDNGQNI